MCARHRNGRRRDAIRPILQTRHLHTARIRHWAHMQTYTFQVYTVSTDGDLARDDYLGPRAISPNSGATFTPHVSAISRKPFRASSRDSPLTFQRNGKSRNEIPPRSEPRYSSELRQTHVECTWNAVTGRDSEFLFLNPRPSKNFFTPRASGCPEGERRGRGFPAGIEIIGRFESPLSKRSFTFGRISLISR